jgi:thiol:disulfide interchange protein
MHFFRISLVIALVLFCGAAGGQVLKLTKWTTSVSKTDVKAGDEIELIFKAHIDDKWHMYSNDFDPDCGPILTTIEFANIKNYQLVGPLKAINALDEHDETFDCDVKIFRHDGEFRQKIKVLGPVSISCTMAGQVCTDIPEKCVQFEEDFLFSNIKVTGSVAAPAAPAKPKGNEQSAVAETPQAPQTATAAPVTIDTAMAPAENTAVAQVQYGENKGPQLDPTLLTEAGYAESSSLWGYIIVAFLLGITSLITPCVFPMIPMTVTFFLKDDQSKKKGVNKAWVFGASIIVIYTVVGTAFAFLFGAEGLNALATHWFPNLLIFVLFIVFALSFLGLFEITAPHQLVNKADQAAEKGGWVGIFFMSATLVLVSFSCTIPLVGNVLVLAAGGQVVKPIMGMFAYSLAFAIPFTLFAMFPEWLKGLPKSGGWLNSVKVTLGLLEIALSLKFLSIADQTYHWGLLDRDVNIAIWIVVFSLLGFYFLGKLRMKSDSASDTVSVPRLALAIVTFSFVIYLIPGLWGAPLKALAGYLPPMHTHDFNLLASGEQNDTKICDEPKYSEFLHLPHGLRGYFDYDQAIACARQQNKPLFIDFTGHGCTNCREMEAVVWSDPQVLQRLQNDFVVVALYVDDKTELPENEWYTSKSDNKVKKSIGKQNADLQITNLENNAQPFYVLVGKDERVLATPFGYKKDAEAFAKFLDGGKKKFQELYKN